MGAVERAVHCGRKRRWSDDYIRNRSLWLVDVLQQRKSIAVRPWVWALLTFLGLNLLLRIPDVLFERFPLAVDFYLADPSRLYYFFSLDLFCLISLLTLLPVDRARPWVYRALGGLIFFLLAYRTYDALVVSAWHRSPMVYADASHALGAAYLLLNASVPWTYLTGALGAGGVLILVARWLPTLLRRLHHHLRGLTVKRGVIAIHILVWPLVGIASITESGIERWTYQEVCLSTVECIAYNVDASVELYRQTAQRSRAPADSTYARYRHLDWTTRPSVYIVMIESYGTALAELPSLKGPYARLMEQTTDTLRSAGWHAASAPSVAPVFGGLSWLSVATLLTGSPVSHQPTYDVLRADLSRYPHLVRFLERQGYRTATVQPPVRARPGLRVQNPYGFDRTFYLQELNYRGPSYGWGIVPDQYSLAFAHERFVEASSQPFFLLFEGVTSHGPWQRPPPPYVETPLLWTEAGGHPQPVQASPWTEEETAWTDSQSGSQATAFFRHIRYDWRVLVDYLRTNAEENSVVLVLGDHQPVFASDRSFTTPVHVLSQDDALIHRFKRHGLTSGLHPSAADTLHHAGLYSLLVRVLTAHDRSSPDSAAASLPPYRVHGVQNAALTDPSW